MREEDYQINGLGDAFEVSKSSYHVARNRPSASSTQMNEEIVSKIKEIHGDRHLNAYASPRMTTELKEEHG